jgi:cytochrome P450
MVPAMAGCINTMVERWVEQIAAGRDEINVHTEFKSLTADIIAHIGFGSSYAEGRRVFELQQEQQRMLEQALLTMYLPGMR